MTDCIIIGSGVGGISSALTLKSNGKSFLLFGNARLSEKILKAERITNYPGLADITGEEFYRALKNQLDVSGIAIEEQTVTGVYPLSDKFGVATKEGGYYESKTVILATGVDAIKTVAGETEFVGKGVSYCATCDGFLYKDKTIAVLCTSKRLEHEIEHLQGIAKKVYLIAMYKDVQISGENVEIIRKMPTQIQGDARVNAVAFKEFTLQVDGVFCLRESAPSNVLLQGIEIKDGHIVVSRDMQTNIKGCYAVGDCTGRPYQYAKAVGEGNVAGQSVTAYVSQNK